MDKNQKRMIAIVLCIIGIVGTLMAGKDASAQRARESASAGIEADAGIGAETEIGTEAETSSLAGK